MYTSTENISQAVTDRKKILLFPTHGMSNEASRLAYLHLTLSHSKDQGQSHVHVDSEYLGKK